jgi:hypothetical protein
MGEHGNELSGSIKGGAFLDNQLLNKDSAAIRICLYSVRVFERYLDLKGRKTDHGEDFIMMNFTACILHWILLV